jgi:hypothetical protein
VSGMITNDVKGGVGALVNADTAGAGSGAEAGQQSAPPVVTAMAPGAVILLLMGEEKKALDEDSPRGGTLDMQL